MWASGIRILMALNDFSETDYEEFDKKAEEMMAKGMTKPILEVLVSPMNMSCVVLTLY